MVKRTSGLSKPCPACGAIAGRRCVGLNGERVSVHRERFRGVAGGVVVKPAFDGTRAKIAEIFEDAKEHILNDLHYQFAWAAQNCESPIEELFVSQMLHPSIASQADLTASIMTPKSRLIVDAQPPPLVGLYIYPQLKIGDYRVDFYIIAVQHDETKTLIVECDGHDFHERTKEQAQRDKSRDRALVGMGHRLIRFTGSEIYANPFACADQALSVLLDIPWQPE